MEKKNSFSVVTVLWPSMLFELLLLSKQFYHIFYCILLSKSKMEHNTNLKAKSKKCF